MKAISSRAALLAASLLAALLGAGAFFFLYLATNTALSSSAARALDIETAGKREAINRSLRVALADSAREREALRGYFLTEDTEALFIEELERIGALSRVSLAIESVTEGEGPSTALGAVRFSLRATGAWARVSHFLALLDALPFVHALEDVSLERAGNEGKSGGAWELRARLSILRIEPS